MTKQFDTHKIHHAIPSAQHLIGNDFIFQHDKDPKHTDMQYFTVCQCVHLGRITYNGRESILDWPPQGPDLNY